jgi:hypothetical protein
MDDMRPMMGTVMGSAMTPRMDEMFLAMTPERCVELVRLSRRPVAWRSCLISWIDLDGSVSLGT